MTPPRDAIGWDANGSPVPDEPVRELDFRNTDRVDWTFLEDPESTEYPDQEQT